MDKKIVNKKKKLKRRMLGILAILMLLFFGLVGRLVYIIVNQGPILRADAVDQWTNEETIEPKRGRILDKNGIEFAISADVFRVDVDLKAVIQSFPNSTKLSDDVINGKLSDIAKKLADATGMKYEDVNKLINQKLKNGVPPVSVNLMRRIEKPVADKVKSLKIYGIMITGDTKRYYPNDNLLSQVLGFTGADGKGITGLEKIYEDQLKGSPGKRIAEVDKRGDDLPYDSITYTKPVNGKDVNLTIDSVVQHFTDQIAEKAMNDFKPLAVSIIISNPNTGEILAMVNKPDYNPNMPFTPGKSSDELNQMWRNRAISDTFEPGSILKVITAAAAMNEGLVQENDTFICNGGLQIGPDYIKCDEPHGKQNFVDIIKNSCNVGFMDLGKRLGSQKLTDYIKLFGFGQKTGIDLNGEGMGILRKPDKMRPVELANLAFGQGDAVTCVQYLAAFNAVANGGKLITPHLLKNTSHMDENNKVIKDEDYKNSNVRQILTPELSQTLRGYLEKVVTDGTGASAFVEGYHIAGKTGTAEKAVNGIYPDGKYIASFVGMAPVDNPKYTVLVSIDEPDPIKHFAAETAAPVTKEVYMELFNYLSMSLNGTDQAILKDVMIPEVRGMNKEDAIKALKEAGLSNEIDNNGEEIVDMKPLPGTVLKEGNKITLITGTGEVASKVVVMPQLNGYAKDKAMDILNKLGLRGDFRGDGAVKNQDIIAGQQVNKGTTVTIDLKSSVD